MFMIKRGNKYGGLRFCTPQDAWSYIKFFGVTGAQVVRAVSV